MAMFVSLSDMKDHLDIPSGNTSQDARLTRFITAASDWIEIFLDRSLESASYEHFFDGRANDRFTMKQWPVTAISGVRVNQDSDFSDANDEMDAEDYSIDNDIGIVLINTKFPRGNRNVRIQYTAGYASIPTPIQEATYWIVEFWYNMLGDRRVGQSSKSKGDETTSYLGEPPVFVKKMLIPYKRCDSFFTSVPVGNN